jgi:hypothetical protein
MLTSILKIVLIRTAILVNFYVDTSFPIFVPMLISDSIKVVALSWVKIMKTIFEYQNFKSHANILICTVQ